MVVPLLGKTRVPALRAFLHLRERYYHPLQGERPGSWFGGNSLVLDSGGSLLLD